MIGSLVNLPEEDVCSFGLELLSHRQASLVQEGSVPRAGHRHARREDARVISNTNSSRTVLHAQTLEPDAWDRGDVTHARARRSRDHIRLLIEGQLGDELLGLGEGLLPASVSSGISYSMTVSTSMSRSMVRAWLGTGGLGGWFLVSNTYVRGAQPVSARTAQE